MLESAHLSKHKCLYLGDSSLSLQRTTGTFCPQLHHKAISTLRILKAIKKNICFQSNSKAGLEGAGLFVLTWPEVGKAPKMGTSASCIQ